MRKAMWLMLLAGLLAAGCKGGTGGTPTGGQAEQPTKSSPAAAAGLTAAKLCDEYRAGQATADGRYKGKEIELQGNILNVRKDQATNQAFLVLKGSGGGNVRCYFTSDQADKVGQMKAGSDVKVKGVCNGRMGGFGESFDVELKACKLVP